MKSIIKLIGKNMLTGAAIVLGAIIMIIGVFAFESLTTTPGTAGNQSLGAQILSILPSGGFNRTTDSLEAISNKVSLIPTTAPSSNNGFVGCETKVSGRTTGTVTITCSAGKSIRSHATTCNGGGGTGNCGIINMTLNSLIGGGSISAYTYGHAWSTTSYNYYSASILCCNN